MIGLAPHDDVDDDGSTNQRCDSIKGNQAAFTRQTANEIAQQGNHSSHQHSGRQQRTVIIGGEQQAGHVRDSQSDESHRTTEGGGDGRKKSRHNK